MKSAKKAVKKAAVARKKAAAKKAGRVVRKVARPKVAAVAAANGDAKVDARSALREEYTIEAKNFGPIAEAKLTLKPLTVLIGPSNVGKTYMATLACMMLRHHVPFLYPVAQSNAFGSFLLDKAGKRDIRDFAVKFVTAMDSGESDLPMSRLSKNFRDAVHREIENKYGEDWGPFPNRLAKCFGAKSIADIASPEHPPLFKFVAHGAVTTELGMPVPPNGIVSPKVKLGEVGVPMGGPLQFFGSASNMRQIANGTSKLPQKEQAMEIHQIIRSQWFPLGMAMRKPPPLANFFPASRGGLMQARHAITIAMIRAAGSGGLVEIPGIPTLPSLSADFLADIVWLTVRSPSPNWTQTPLTKKIESLLGGEVFIQHGGKNKNTSAESLVPQVMFKPNGVSDMLTLAQSSSMVCEIAPLVLHLKAGKQRGNTMFIEEPEAHLHPTAQTTMAAILAAMVRAGIRVVITTHSDWLLDSIANLVRQGETNPEDILSLKEDEVGVYWFKPGKSGKGSKSILLPFDNDNGYLPKDVREESTALYNKAVPLQIKLDEMRDK